MLQCSIPERGEQLEADRDAFGDLDPPIGSARPNLRLVAVPMRNHERTSGTPKVRGGFHGWPVIRMCGIALRKLKSA